MGYAYFRIIFGDCMGLLMRTLLEDCNDIRYMSPALDPVDNAIDGCSYLVLQSRSVLGGLTSFSTTALAFNS